MSMWVIPEETTFHRGYGEELLAVICDGDLAASRLVRDLRARVTVAEAECVAFPRRVILGFDGSTTADISALWIEREGAV